MHPKVRSLIFIMVLYAYLYNPIFNAIGIGSVKFLMIASIAYAFLNKEVLSRLSCFGTELIFVFIVVIYSLITGLRSEDGIFTEAYLFIVWFFESIFTPIALTIFFQRELEKTEWSTWLVRVGIIAALTSIFLIINPSINDYVRYSLLQTTGSEYDEYHFIRGFGFADGLRGVYALIQAIIMGICLFRLRKNYLYALPVLCIIISIAFNARTGLLAIPVSLFFLIIQFKLSFRIISVFAAFVFLIVNLAIFFPEFISDNVQTMDWLMSGYSEIAENLSGESGVASETLLGEEKFMPSDITTILLGAATHGQGAARADNGYYYILWYGGWVLMLILLLFVLYMFIRVSSVEKEKYYPYLFFSLLLIFNVKWNYLINPSGLSRLIGFYYVVTILVNRKYLRAVPSVMPVSVKRAPRFSYSK